MLINDKTFYYMVHFIIYFFLRGNLKKFLKILENETEI